MYEYGLSENEAGAITYYTSDARGIGQSQESPYRVLNPLLAQRDREPLEQWKDFLFFLLNGLKKLPDYKGKVWRGFDKPISQLSYQYRHGNTIIWVAVTSTTRNRNKMLEFAKPTQGTLMQLNVTEGKDISFLSLYPEEEILLPPNTYLVVDQILDNNMKELTNLPAKVDAVILSQKPTPEFLKAMEQPNWKQLYEEEKKRNELLLQQLIEAKKRKDESELVEQIKDEMTKPTLEGISTNYKTQEKFEKCLKKFLQETEITSKESLLEVLTNAHNTTQGKKTRNSRSIFVGVGNSSYGTTRKFYYKGKYGKYWFVLVDD